MWKGSAPGVRLTNRRSPRPGLQELVYTIYYEAPLATRHGRVGPGASTLIIDVNVKEP